MPFDTKIENNAVIARYYGTVTFDDVIKSSGVSWGDPVWDTINYYITDFLKTEKLDMRPDQAIALAHMDNASFRRGVGQKKRAFVVTKPEIIELLEVFQRTLEAGNWEIRLFDNIETAFDWLNSCDEPHGTI
jgi:hypothetical protein